MGQHLALQPSGGGVFIGAQTPNMPESLYHLILFAGLCNLGCNIYMGFLEAPVHGFLLDAYAVDHQV